MNQSFFLFFFMCSFNLFYLVPSLSATPIIGGTPDDQHTFKHHVSLHRKSKSLDTYEYFCGGSIISEKHILTTAYCFLSNTGLELIKPFGHIERRMKILAGINKRNGLGIERIIIRIFIPKIYRSETHSSGDISVGELSRTFNLFELSPWISSVPMFDLDPRNDEAKHGIFSGFGATNSNHRNDMALINHSLEVFLRRWSDCPGDGYVICAINLSPELKTACNGDMGSGLLVQDQIVGVLSYGPPKCDSNILPIVFTRIKTFRNFIDHAMNPRGYYSDMYVFEDREEASSSGTIIEQRQTIRHRPRSPPGRTPRPMQEG